MKNTIILISIFSFLTIIRATTVDPKVYIQAVKGLVKRHYPKLEKIFTFEIIPKTKDDKDVFEIESKMSTEKKVIIRGNNGVSLSTGLGYYMRYHAHTQISWTGDQLINADPDLLPKEDFSKHVESPLKYSYYMNTCTHSYSAAWWNWERWEREIDWMVLKGINFPLAFTGQEYIWYKLFIDMGLSDQGIKEWMSGPAFLAWFRMGNLQKWGGPISDKFIQNQHDLQIQILQRMREFGMMPILPMFTGFVPEEIKKIYPTANITRRKVPWAGFSEEYRNWNLDASDPLFNQIGQKFIELQTKEYGTDHYYNGDMFNENEPPSSDPKYLEQAGRGTYLGLKAFDEKAIWVMQGWLFWNSRKFWGKEQVKAYLSGVPNDKMIILDLYTESHPVWNLFENYYDKPWIWCTLINFGGNPPLRGDVKYLLSQPHIDRESNNSKMVGVGITMEAIDQNYIDYEATLEAKWRNKAPESAEKWILDYVHYRYGDEVNSLPKVQDGWKLIHKNVYNQSASNGTVIERRPNFNGLKDGPMIRESPYSFDYIPAHDDYNGKLDEMAEGWGYLLDDEVVKKIGKIQTYIIDIVDIGTYCLESTFNMLRVDLFNAYNEKNLEKIDFIGFKMKNIINDLDKLNGASNYTILGKWIENAKKFGDTQEEKDLLEYNARIQVTTWNKGVDSHLNDYAHKSWSGLYKDYYLKRWSLFIEHVRNCVDKGKKFNQDAYNKDVYDKVEGPWQFNHTKYPPSAVGDAATIGQEIFNKYFKKN